SRTSATSSRPCCGASAPRGANPGRGIEQCWGRPALRPIALLLTPEIIRSKDVSASRSEACVPKGCGVGVGASRKGEGSLPLGRQWRVGLEDAGEVVSLATTEPLERALADEDDGALADKALESSLTQELDDYL